MNRALIASCVVAASCALHAQQAIQYTLSKESMDKAVKRYSLAFDKINKNKEVITLARQIQAFALQNNATELPEGSSQILAVKIDPETLNVEKEFAELKEEICYDFSDYGHQVDEKIKVEDLWKKLIHFSNLVLLGANK